MNDDGTLTIHGVCGCYRTTDIKTAKVIKAELCSYHAYKAGQLGLPVDTPEQRSKIFLDRLTETERKEE